MKKMLFQFQASKMTKALMLCVCFFFVGMASINAQYVSNDEASQILKVEVQTLHDAIPTATTNEAKEDIAFKLRYYMAVLVDVNNGNEVGAAIVANTPVDKALIHSSGLVHFSSTAPNFKMEVEALISATDGLLSE